MNDFQKIPADLRASSSWLVWKLGPLNPKTGKHSKLPCNHVTGIQNDKSDPSIWVSFDTAVSLAQNDPRFSGIGLLPMGKIIGLDLDKCRNKETGEIDAWAKDWITRLNSYSEVSPSGDGLHTWFLGEAPPKKMERKDGAEVYADKTQYLTVTGQHLEGTPLTLRTLTKTETAEVFKRVRQGKSVKTPTPSTSVPAPQKLQRLLDGDISAAGTEDYSAAVHECLVQLAVQTLCDPAEMKRLFEDSPLCKGWKEKDGKTSKWPRRREEELEKACVKGRERLRKQLPARPQEPKDWREVLPAMTDDCWVNLPQSEMLVEELALVHGVHILAGLFESYKTMAALALSAAFLASPDLSGKPVRVFDGLGKGFEVKRRAEVIFLCPDMSPELFKEYASQFGLDRSPGFRAIRPQCDVALFLDTPCLQEAVKDRVLFIDTMWDYAQIKDAYRSGEWIDFFKKVRDLINLHGCLAVFMLAHPTKAGARSTEIDPTEFLKDSVTFGGKIDVGLAFRPITNSSQILVKRVKGRGFKDKEFGFTLTVRDEQGNSYISRGEFPVYERTADLKKIQKAPGKKEGRPPDPEKAEKVKFMLDLIEKGEARRERPGELAEKVNTEFGCKMGRHNVTKWLKEDEEEKRSGM